MQIRTPTQTHNHASIPPLSFLQAGCPSCRPTNSIKALKGYCGYHYCSKLLCLKMCTLSILTRLTSYIYCSLKPIITSAEEGGYVFGSVCLSVCPSDYSQTRERILTKFFGGVGHGSRTKWYNFGGDPDHASDPGVQSPKSGSSGSAEVCALWVLLVIL